MLTDPSIYRKIDKVMGLLQNPRIQGEDRRELYLELMNLRYRANSALS